ncbi:MAG: N(4)-(beta-N-acetylglucosaminyl)-L-asparaginase [Saprospiraceae bacterium]|nr:N(4)-(beta-N-acetylglucosaminyl)-L-asparaginase [Saprospiraceae bacterium]
MLLRRTFLRKGLMLSGLPFALWPSRRFSIDEGSTPKFIATWNNKIACETAMQHIINRPQELLTAIEKGIHIPESDPNDTSVGYGGFPDRTGEVTLDACIMDHRGNAGSVTYLKGFMHPISVARKVMEDTPHVMLSGQGAYEFALQNGFEPMDLNTDESKKRYKEWLKESNYAPKINSERHDTIGLLGIDKNGRISGGCSTSGLSFKMSGRVGDSPIIGSGLYVDPEYGSASCTGLGEVIMRHCTAFLVTEFMRQGMHPVEACKKAIARICKRDDVKNIQVGIVALDKQGRTGAYSIHKGFNYIVCGPEGTELIESDSYFS